jgi:flagellar motor protein MotB
MARNPWNDDPDLAALRPRRGSMPWGRILIGVVLVGCGTFGLAYYLPLHRAHRSLSDDHARLRGELESVQGTLTKLSGELKNTTARYEELAAERDKRESASKGQSAELSGVKSAVSSALDKVVKKKQAAVGADESGVRVALSSNFVFTTGKLETSGGGKVALCDVAKAAGSRPLRIVGVSDDVPALLQAKFTTTRAYTAAATAAVADTLVEKCSVPAARISAESPGTPRPAGAAFGGDTPPASRVEVVISAPAAAK